MATKQQIEDKDEDEILDHESEYEDTQDDDDEEGASGAEDSDGVDESLSSTSDEEPEESSNEEPEKDEREAIRARRREERKQKKIAAREREDWLRAELAARDQIIDQMRHQLDGISNQGYKTEIDKAEKVKQDSAQAYAYWKEQIKVGTENQNGALVAEATEKMLAAQTRFGQAEQYQQSVKQAVQRQSQAAPNQIDPRLANYAKNWMSSNPWYSTEGKDQDSRIVSAIDNALASEGYNPSTPEYWDELTLRVKDRLPHRFKPATVQSSKPKSVVSGSGRNGASAPRNDSAKGLSAERVQALKDAGLWDDPKKRSAAIKEFQAYDKANRI